MSYPYIVELFFPFQDISLFSHTLIVTRKKKTYVVYKIIIKRLYVSYIYYLLHKIRKDIV